MSTWQKFLTVKELENELEKVCDELDSERADKIDVVCLSPPTVDEISDEEAIDDNEQLLVDSNDLPTELAGELEMVCEYNDGNRHAPPAETELQQIEAVASTSNQSSLTTKSRKRTSKGDSGNEKKRKNVVPILPKWKKVDKQPEFAKQPVDISINKVEELYAKLGGKSPMELFELFIDDEVIELIVKSTNKYAQVDKNKHLFETNADEIKKFIGILYLTGFHTLPTSRAYWSTSPLLGSNVVKDTMSRNRFEVLKQNLHVCDNVKLNKSDKFSKMSPFNELLNKRFMQFGVFSHKLSIDEQMIAYFGRHSCKMFIRGKPIRFGYKYWNICSAEGYLYQFIPYAGASSKTDYEYTLSERVVLQLLSILEHKNQHCVAFDNFFTSHNLLRRLSGMGYFATGTIRENRTNHAKVKDVKVMKKCERGSHDQCFDADNEIFLLRWNDNAVVTLASNHVGFEPMHRAKRFDHKEKKMGHIPMPQIVRHYNNTMGGVDLHDNAVNNYRIRVRGKKWYWPLFTNGLDSAMVNAWKLHCLFRRHIENKSIMSQLDFRIYVTECLLIANQKPRSKAAAPSKVPSEVRHDKTDHLVERSTEKRKRCRICHKHTFYKCSKCQIALHSKCFAAYHMS